ncbi:hypothetical protein [Streptomyces sp. MP131-18]|uniref:Rv1733c family protein n=1 Tax=Streptomyces sp. MP131-18 TaxID=1857892 RepID=UPI00097C5EA5|nr:hypothetical protein [Streptomyces sp. MP131-18]ONK10424.1 hypothetical protein STBA_11460 [Streptomyces sp. MP131-18]
MAGTVRRWRRRRNPLRRTTDVAEAWVGFAAVAVMAVGAPAAGVATAVAVGDALLEQGREARQQRAVVLERAPVPAVTGAAVAAGRMRAVVRWTEPDGTVRVDQARVADGTEQGTWVTVWVDGRGRPTGSPAAPAEAWFGATTAGSAAAVCVGLAAAGARIAVRAHLDARRFARWDREWAEIAPRWSRPVT